MALEIKLSQKLSQTLVMTPQLQQAIRMLQLGRLDYLEEIEREVLENPLLEARSDSDPIEDWHAAQNDWINIDTVVDVRGVTGDTDFSGMEFIGEVSSSLDGIDEGSSPGSWDAQDFQISHSFDSHEHYPGGDTGRGNFEAEASSLEATVSVPEGLTGHILRQLRSLILESGDDEIVEHIIGNLDRSGYLTCSVEEIAEICGREVVDVSRVLDIIHHLDPCGVAARDLRECLLIQLQERGLDERLEGRLVSAHLESIEKRRYDVIAKSEKCSVDQVYDALKVISKLEPCPGRAFSNDPPIYITPDIYIKKIGDEYVISLNESGIPKLRISDHYRELLEKGQLAKGSGKDYVQECLKRGQWLMKAVDQRQSTIYKVTKSIMQYQREFLDKGVTSLKPLVLREVAQDVGLHESTVSRVTSNKYVHTPRGVFELKFFFSSGLTSDSGDVSSESVKSKLRDIIAQENSKSPLSDQAIANILKKDGIDIARRTVAKYREMLNVLPSSKRKKHF